MSTDTEHVEEESETSPSLLETWSDWYHIPLIGAVMLFMFWVRTQAYDQFVTEDGSPALAGVDSWYQWRTIEWTAENYPNTMPYEVWTGFPEGNYVGQFGTLFDQLIVTVAMIVGLGDPSPETVYTVALLMIPAMAALVAIPVFYAGRRLGGTLGGIVSVLVLALAKGQFLTRSTVGQLDHHIGEVLFMAISVVTMMVALTVAERDQPIYELVVDRDWDALRTSTIYSVLAGVALTLYIWVWPSAVLLVGIFGVFFAVQLCLDYLRGISPDHVAFVGAVSLGVTTILTLLLMENPGSTSSTSFGLLQPLAAFLVAVGCVFMAWLARQWNDRDIERRYYPVAIGGLIAAALLAMWLLLPSIFDSIVGNATRRMLPFGGTATDLTISEAQPPEDFFDSVFSEFGSAFYTMLAGLAFVVIRPLFGRRIRAEHTLVVVWALFLISMAATQVRFMYYLVLAIAVVNAAFVAEFVRLFDLDLTASLESIRGIETYQVIVLFLVVILLFAPLLPPIAADGTSSWEQAESTGPSGDAMVWEGSNEWLAENTPAPGNWGEHENADQLEYFGTYGAPADGDYDYPDGAYGVMSWWDYGHLITTQGERIPHANPFQQNAPSASSFLTAESEERGELVLDTIAAGENPADKSTEELESLSEGATNEELRYVMIDYEMAAGKFSAITAWSGPNYEHYVTPEGHEDGQPVNINDYQNGTIPYYDTMQSKLYFDDADGLEHYRTVHENADAGTATIVTYANVFVPGAIQGQVAQELQELGYQEGDVIYYQDGEFAAPGEGRPSVAIQQMGFQQIQQVQQNPTQQLLGARSAAAVKTFERVEGATLTGTVDDDADVLGNETTATVEVELETNAGRTFNYTQETEVAEDGSFELTVPYATNDELGVEDGYTNSSVEATGEYEVTVGEPGETGYATETAVPETEVVTGETITVDGFEQTELEDPDESDGNETDGNETDDGNETADGNQTDDSNQTDGNQTDDGADTEDN
ncbi:oligosaccharyl transferase, archaeosortase A system-associated [Haloterrigena sp. SYSU A558-1]|uniref:dolichyl-phosphooligosaccharide-protein glycotransferase n=1 Tax=Haloterrigena gelatinilytica TaxID=2741724 RepID=A0ABX2LCN4_9EURY|nr:oligosaccharyl transferase, archaeosortase A system-associated [Haloterrigena gelatinilytica]NUC70859.1 oligosaccharyl transferase, archaeosortase A system-associated [Haloterrigena gelatinilytica]